MLWTSIVLMAMVLPLANVPTAWGQSADKTARADSILAAVMDSIRTAGMSVNPEYKGNVIGNVRFVQMVNNLAVNGPSGFGPLYNASLGLDKKEFRLQPRSEETKTLAASLAHQFSREWTGSLAYNDRRQFNRVAVQGGSISDFILNDQAATTSVAYQAPGRQFLRYDAHARGTTAVGEKTFKTDNTQTAAVNGGARFTLRSRGHKAVVSVRGARSRSRESSRTQFGQDVFELPSFSGSEVEDLGANVDSVVTAVAVTLRDSTRITVSYSDYLAVRSFADQARGSLGGQLAGSQNLIWEKETRTAEVVDMLLESRPVRGMSLRVDTNHSVIGADYATQLTRFSQTTTDRIRASISYRMRWGTTLASRIERREQFRDLGPQSVGSFDELSRNFNLMLEHQFSRTFSVRGTYDATLAQSFYVSPTNPRDRDQLENSVTANINSLLWEKLDVKMKLNYTKTDFVNIDKSQSFNNREKERFDFRPTLSLRLSDLLTVDQTYGLAWEVTHFNFHDDDDSLDRTISFANTFRMILTARLTTTFLYQLELHDRGAYVPVDFDPLGQKFFTPRTEDRSDILELGMRYRLNPHLAAELDYEFSQRVDRTIRTGAEQVKNDGGIVGGFVGSYNWGDRRTLNLELKKANRFGEFSTDIQNDYWVMNSSVVYAF